MNAMHNRREFGVESGEPYPRHLQLVIVAASFRTWPSSSPYNARRPAFFIIPEFPPILITRRCSWMGV